VSLFSEDMLKALMGYSWPGNVRELKHVIERMVVMSKGGVLTFKDLPKEVREAKKATAPAKGVQTKSDAEKENIIKALAQTNDNRSNAAKLLGITRKTLFNKIKKYGLE